MADKLKKFKKNAKKLADRLDSDRGLTLKQTYDVTTAFYSRGKESAPHVVFTSKGDYRISVLKLLLIILGAAVGLAIALLALKAFVVKLLERKPRPAPLAQNDFTEYDLDLADDTDEGEDELSF